MKVKVDTKILELFNKKNPYGESPLYLAIKAGNVKKVEMLLQYDVDINNVYRDESALKIALKYIAKLNPGDKKLDIISITEKLIERTTTVSNDELALGIYVLRVDLIMKLIKKCQSLNNELKLTYTLGDSSKEGNLLHFLAESPCDHKIFEAVLERIIELNQLKSRECSAEKFSIFFSQRQKAAAFSKQVPNEFICPITNEIMKNPVTLEDGYSYEEEAIKIHLTIKTTSPITNLALKSPEYVENRMLKNMIEAFNSAERPQIQRTQSLPELRI